MNGRYKFIIKQKNKIVKRFLRFLKVNFFYRFIIISSDKARLMNLEFYKNVYGDGINMHNCRSFWSDEYGFLYRCKDLNLD